MTGFFESLRGRQIALLGAGVSHEALVLKMAAQGLDVTVCDRQPREKLGDGTTAARLEAAGAKLRLGEDYLEGLERFGVIFRTPGFYFGHPALKAAREAGCVVTSELECFFDNCGGAERFAVTGSDGKTTTTTLIAKMLERAGRRVHLGGNLGRALLPVLDEVKTGDCVVCELSSFQLQSMRQAYEVALVTNVAPNHLDVHRDMDEYIAAKKNIYAHQNAFSRTVLNYDNDITAAMAKEVRGDVIWFSRKQKPPRGSFLDDARGMLCFNEGGTVTDIMPAGEITLPGVHNVENVLAAAACVWGRVAPGDIRAAAAAFKGVEHRIEFVRELDGVRWYNDSIASSPTRVIAGLRSFEQRLVVIAGGSDKNIPFDTLAPEINKHVRLLILTGATREKIYRAVVDDASYDSRKIEIIMAADIPEAVQTARAKAVPGDIVTLSPACASFDSYRNFEYRGRHFKDLVNAL